MLHNQIWIMKYLHFFLLKILNIGSLSTNQIKVILIISLYAYILLNKKPISASIEIKNQLYVKYLKDETSQAQHYVL
jgi:hypothetical protein